MRAVAQRVTSARVVVADEVVGAIGRGLLVYVGVARTDTEAEAAWLADRLAGIRLFPAETAEGARSMERSVLDVGGAVLLVSQFTLLADTRKGRRPSFFDAAHPTPPSPSSTPSPPPSRRAASRSRQAALARIWWYRVTTMAR